MYRRPAGSPAASGRPGHGGWRRGEGGGGGGRGRRVVVVYGGWGYQRRQKRLNTYRHA